MTTKIQKQFFEKYNIPKRFYTIVNLGDLDNNEINAALLIPPLNTASAI